MPEPRRFGRIRAALPPMPFSIAWSRRGGYETDDRTGDPIIREGKRVPLPLTDEKGEPIGGFEDFRAVAEAPGGMVLDLSTAETNPQAVIDYLRAALVTDDRERFDHLIRDSDRLVEFRDLLEVVEWLVQEHTGVPTMPSRSTQPGR